MKKQTMKRGRRTKAPEQVKSEREYNTLNSDEPTATLDAALTAAESKLRCLLPRFQPSELAVAFEDHVRRHLTIELKNIKAHGHRGDDANDPAFIASDEGDDEPIRFRNYYRCPNDGTEWSDEWSCQCNDRCPKCNTEIEPYESEDI